MSLLANNIRVLRKSNKLTQAEFASRVGVNRSVIGAYEEGRAEPKLQTLQAICQFFKISVDSILNTDHSSGIEVDHIDSTGQNLRILPIALDKEEDKELVTLVPEKASAGYTGGYTDTEYIGNLPQFDLPFPELRQDKTYRVFQIKGDSMLPLKSGTYIIAEYLTDWNDIKDNNCYVLLSKEDGIVYKRLVNNLKEQQSLELRSDNNLYEPYSLHANSILEVWKALGSISFDLPSNELDTGNMEQLMKAVKQIQQQMSAIGKS